VPQPHLATLGWSPEQAQEWAAEVQAEFSLWADSPECDWYGELNFYQQQDLVTRSRLESGDCFTVLPDGNPTVTQPYALRLQVLEADRVGNPAGKADTAQVAGGVRRAEGGGVVTGFHVYHQHPGGLWLAAGGSQWAGDWIEPVGPSGRRRMLHHFKRLRPEQPRGVPYLAPVMGLFKLLGDYTDAEVKAAVISAWLTLVIETPTGAGLPQIFGLQQQGGAAPQAGDNQAPTGNIEMGPGHTVSLAKGEKASVVNPGRPNPAFGPFVEAVLDQLGAGTFLGSEMLLKKFSTSYTAARAAFLDAYKHVLDVRNGTALDFCQPVVETWMAEAVYRGRIRAPGFFSDPRLRWAYTRAGWHGDSQGSLNPKDEVAAMRDAVDARLVTRERAQWELFGDSFAATYGAKKAEHDKLAADGMLPAPRAGAAAMPTPAPAPGGAQ
jgi:lambda family phage portal protein